MDFYNLSWLPWWMDVTGHQDGRGGTLGPGGYDAKSIRESLRMLCRVSSDGRSSLTQYSPLIRDSLHSQLRSVRVTGSMPGLGALILQREHTVMMLSRS